MANSLTKGPWTVAYHVGDDNVTAGFTFLTPLNPGGEVKVYQSGNLLVAENFMATSTIDAILEASLAFSAEGYSNGPSSSMFKAHQNQKQRVVTDE